jgi:hypothetical protein
MAKHTYNWSKAELNENVSEFMAGERDSVSPYQSPDLSSRLMRERPEEISAAEYYDIKKLFEYLIKENKDHKDSIKEQNKVLRDSITSINVDIRDKMNHDRKALQDSMEINKAKLQND